jgi:hypothetical protein
VSGGVADDEERWDSRRGRGSGLGLGASGGADEESGEEGSEEAVAERALHILNCGKLENRRLLSNRLRQRLSIGSLFLLRNKAPTPQISTDTIIKEILILFFFLPVVRACI